MDEEAAGAGEPVREGGAQGGLATRVAVSEGGGGEFGEDGARGAQPGGAREGGEVGTPRCEVDAGGQLAQGVEDGLARGGGEGIGGRGRGRAGRDGAGYRADDRAAAAPALDGAVLGESPVRLGDGAAGEAERGGEGAGGRQPVAGGEAALGDRAAHFGDEPGGLVAGGDGAGAEREEVRDRRGRRSGDLRGWFGDLTGWRFGDTTGWRFGHRGVHGVHDDRLVPPALVALTAAWSVKEAVPYGCSGERERRAEGDEAAAEDAVRPGEQGGAAQDVAA